MSFVCNFGPPMSYFQNSCSITDTCIFLVRIYVVDLGYEGNSLLSLFEFIQEKKSI